MTEEKMTVRTFDEDVHYVLRRKVELEDHETALDFCRMLEVHPGAVFVVPEGTHWYVTGDSWKPQKVILKVGNQEIDVTNRFNRTWNTKKYFIGPFDLEALEKGLWLPRGVAGPNEWRMCAHQVGGSCYFLLNEETICSDRPILAAALLGEACLHVTSKYTYAIAPFMDLETLSTILGT